MTSLLGRQLASADFDTGAWADLLSFEVAILDDAQGVSADFAVPDLPRPDGGFAASHAFEPDSPLADRLRAEHDAAMRDLYYGPGSPPTFDEVLDQVHADATLLDA